MHVFPQVNTGNRSKRFIYIVLKAVKHQAYCVLWAIFCPWPNLSSGWGACWEKTWKRTFHTEGSHRIGQVPLYIFYSLHFEKLILRDIQYVWADKNDDPIYRFDGEKLMLFLYVIGISEPVYLHPISQQGLDWVNIILLILSIYLTVINLFFDYCNHSLVWKIWYSTSSPLLPLTPY